MHCAQFSQWIEIDIIIGFMAKDFFARGDDFFEFTSNLDYRISVPQ